MQLGDRAAAALEYGKEVRLAIRALGRHGLDAFERAEKDVQQVQHMDAVAQKNAMLARVGAGKTCMAIDGAGRQQAAIGLCAHQVFRSPFMFARKVDPTVDAQTVRRDQHPSHARMRCTLGRGWLSSLALALLTPDPSPEQVRLWDEWMQRKLKGVADPDQEPLGGPSREQSPLERGSSGGAAAARIFPNLAKHPRFIPEMMSSYLTAILQDNI